MWYNKYVKRGTDLDTYDSSDNLLRTPRTLGGIVGCDANRRYVWSIRKNDAQIFTKTS
jgi:hypothetical protein